MSRTLSKVLIICALVVVLPLMIAGTAFAAYYAINATVSIEIFVDQNVDGGYAEVAYKDNIGKIDKALKITDGHLKKVTFKTSAVGYEFVGWYAGTYEAYVKELEKVDGNDVDKMTYAIKTQNAKVEMTDYQNLVAVFKAKKFTVGYSYENYPERSGLQGAGVVVTEAPASGEYLIVNGATDTVGKYEFVYGEALPTLELKDKPEFHFDGWYIGTDRTTKYTKANFAQDTNIVLSGDWVDSKHINLTYLDDKGNELKKVVDSLYENHRYELDSVESYFGSFSEGYVENGYSYEWEDVATGNKITEINSDKDVVVRVSKNVINYKAKVEFDDNELAINGNVSKELTFSVENKETLNVWNLASSWTPTYKFWVFDGLTYNGEAITDLVGLINKTIEENPHKGTTITLDAHAKALVTSVYITADYKSSMVNGNAITYSGDVYTEDGLLSNGDYTIDFDDPALFDKTLFEVLKLQKEVKAEDGTTTYELMNFFKDSAKQEVIQLNSLKVSFENEDLPIKFLKIDKDQTLNDLVDFIFAEYEDAASLVVDGKLSFDVVVRFL